MVVSTPLIPAKAGIQPFAISSDYADFMVSRLDAALDDQVANLRESLEGRAG